MKQQPLVSIIIPCYNHAKFVQESIQSVISQDYKNIELIIIDDGSKDNSVDKIQELIPVCEIRFKRFEFRYRSNKGLCATLNEALEWCEGVFFSPIASDDVLLSNKTSFLVQRIIETGAPAVFGSITQIGNGKKKIGVNFITTINFEQLILHKKIPPAPGALVNKNKVIKAGGYDPSLKIEDWYIWLKLCEMGEELIIYPEVLVKYRKHENNTVNNIYEMHKNRLHALERFSHNKYYNRGMIEIKLLHAKQLVEVNRIGALLFLLGSRICNFGAIKVIIKAFTPKAFLKLKRMFL